MLEEIQQIKQDLEEIQQRNKRVELDKAWETSLARKIIVALLTYVVVVVFFYFATLPKPWVNAIVPTMGFLISTLSVAFFKKLWIKSHKKRIYPSKFWQKGNR
jgi:hypothetical protein